MPGSVGRKDLKMDLSAREKIAAGAVPAAIFLMFDLNGWITW